MSPSTRALLAAAREGLGPDPAAAARVRAKLNATLAGTAAPAAAASTGLMVKLAALAVIGAAAAIAIPQHAPAPTAVPAISLPEAAQVDVPPPSVYGAVREPAAPAPLKPVSVHIATPAEAAPPPPPAPVAEVSLAREVELLDDAMASLRAGNPTEALAAVAAFHRETGDRGQLLEEAAAIEIEASCKLHLDVTTKLAAFDQAWPSSPQRARLTAACH